MKLVSFDLGGSEGARVGALDGESVLELPYADTVAGMRAVRAGTVAEPVAEHSLAAVTLGPPVRRPGKIVCVGLNYRDHASETEMAIPVVPLLFAKFPSSVIGPAEPIELHSVTEQLDWEAELAAVIAVQVRDVPEATALDAVGGYMNLNDVSARDVQLGEGGQWTRGKSFDTFAPTGPFLATADEVGDPQDLNVECLVNGEVMQSASTADMIFPVAHLIAFISRSLTLEPGDIIATGTPPGVGMGRTPPRYLEHGDRVTVHVTGLGELTNSVHAIA